MVCETSYIPASIANSSKLRRITTIGILVMGYAAVEIGYAVYIGSLAMFADGILVLFVSFIICY